jgi:hypothetical protein
MVTSLSNYLAAFLILLLMVMPSCNRHSPTPNNDNLLSALFPKPNFGAGVVPGTTQRISKIGDADGLGIGLENGDMWDIDTAGTVFPVDYRDDDPDFTDIFPATTDGVINYVHIYEEPLDTVTEAFFVFRTLGIEDSSLQNIDIKFYIDGDEIVGAFDKINQVKFYNGKKYQTFGQPKFYVPVHLLPHLQDGEVEVRWEVVQQGGNDITDDFAIDYAFLILSWAKQNPPNNISLHHLELGDRDNFGTGLDNLYNWSPDSADSFPVDNRTIDDPYFTDIYPAHLDGVIEFDYVFDLVADSIISARLFFSAFGIQDGDGRDLAYNDTDIKLFLDGIEIDGAFDQTDQMLWRGGLYLPAPSGVTVPIPDDLIQYIKDGEARIRLEVYQYGASDELDKFAIDYSVLSFSTI